MKKKRIIISILLLMSIAFCLPFTTLSVKAEDEATAVNTEIFTPNTYREYFSLISPTDVYVDEEITAVIENNGGDKQITVYLNDTFKTFTKDVIALSNIIQIKRYKDYLIVQDKQRPYLFNFTTNEYSELKTDEGSEIPCDYFAFNDNYFIAINNQELNLYSINYEDGVMSLTDLSITINSVAKQCVAINENNDIFFIKGTALNKANVNNVISVELTALSLNSNCTGLIANNNFVYFSTTDGIGGFDLVKSEKFDLLETGLDYTLGNVVAPMGLAFNGENLLVCDTSISAVQEFSVSDNTASFTGFAITSSAKAKNRITDNAKDVEMFYNKLAILDEEKVTVVSNLNGEKSYSTIALEQVFDGATFIALNDKTVCLANSDADTIVFYDLYDEEVALTFDEIDTPNVKDVTYSNGYFYMLVYPNGKNPQVVAIDETDFSYKTVVNLNSVTNNDLLSVDNDGNVYVYDDQSKVIREYDQGAYSLSYTYENVSDVIKLETDLNGNVYYLTAENNVVKLNNKTEDKKIFTLKLSANLTGPFIPDTSAVKTLTATSFCLNFDSKTVYFLFGNDGLMLQSTELENANVIDSVPSEILVTDTSVDVFDLDIVTVNKDVNVYETEKVESGYVYKTFSKLTEEKTFVLIAESEDFFVISDGKIYIVKKSQATTSPADIVEKVMNGYASTSVNMYYFPIMTIDNTFVLEGFTRLKQGDAVTITNEVTVNGTKFYLASIETDGVLTKGYIPSNFITENLAEAPTTINFTFRTVSGRADKKITVYNDKALSQEIFEITAKQQIKVFYSKDGISHIEFTDKDGNVVNGFIKTSKIDNAGENAVRNAVIVVILGLAVLTTSIFFINKQRD